MEWLRVCRYAAVSLLLMCASSAVTSYTILVDGMKHILYVLCAISLSQNQDVVPCNGTFFPRVSGLLQRQVHVFTDAILLCSVHCL